MKEISLLRLLIYVILSLAALIVVPIAAYEVLFRLQHPAPLGRTATAIAARLEVALPPGTTRDSVIQFLRHRNLAFGVDSSPRALRLHARDSLAAGGPIVFVRLDYIDTDWFGCRAIANIAFYFALDERLIRRSVTPSTTGCM